MFENILEKENRKVFLLGNEAVVRGALEAGVQYVSTYPGTPASEIGNNLYQIQNSDKKIKNLHFEFSVNEKVAIEGAAGAAFSGLRSLVAMKNFGLNVASDFLLPLVYTGIKAGMVILIADDPSCWSSAQSEENTRAFAYLSHIPILEPSTPQECKDFVKLGFELSEKFDIPIMVRETTRVSHQSAPVKLDKINISRTVLGNAKFIKNHKKFVTMPPRVLEMHQELLEKIEKIRNYSEKSPLNKIEEGSTSIDLGIITSGISYLYVKEAIKELNLSLPVLKLGFFHPLPKKKIKKFIKGLKKVLIVEELDPYLEREITVLAKQANCQLEIVGKELISEVGELKPEIVIQAVAKISKINYKLLTINYKLPGEKRHPQLCSGCPYWLIFSGIKRATKGKDVIFGGGIGCYMLAGLPPHNIQDYLYCMGASAGIAHGIAKASGPTFAKASTGKQKVISLMGDSTFFHSGIPPIINAVFNKSNPLIIIMNNSTTAMTGHQPHPAAAKVEDKIDIESLVRSCGVKNLKVIDPVKQNELVKTIQEFLNKKEVSVIIARHPCKFVQE